MSEISREDSSLSSEITEKKQIDSHIKPYYTTTTEEAPPEYDVTATGKDGSPELESGAITADTTLDTSLQLVTKTLDSSDDPSESPYTFRAWFLGIGLSCFGSVIAEIFYFKPQTIAVNIIFLAIISYVFGEAFTLIPRLGPIGRFLNPGNFNQKEHCFITIMAISASVCALGTEQLAAQSLYYNETPNPASAIFMLFSSQMLGYGMLGSIRKLFVYPTKMLWPTKLPLASLFQSLHLDKDSMCYNFLCLAGFQFSFLWIWMLSNIKQLRKNGSVFSGGSVEQSSFGNLFLNTFSHCKWLVSFNSLIGPGQFHSRTLTTFLIRVAV